MDLLSGRYRLLAPLGKGGMGTVWRAVDELLHQEVAVKEVRLPPDLDDASRDQLCERTLREARAAARLRAHPSIVTVHDVVMEDGRPWIVMELVHGRSLDQIVREDGPLPPERVAAIGLALLDALSAAHELGVLHRDVKPANVLLNTGGHVILTDFGIATVTGDTTLTQTGMLTGSPGYMAPERLRGEEERPESDLWSLGSTLYTAVEGRRAFARDNVPATMAAVLLYAPDAVERAGPLAPVLGRLLDKDPVRRCNSAEAAALLHDVATGGGPGPGAGSGPGAGLGMGPGAGVGSGAGVGVGVAAGVGFGIAGGAGLTGGGVPGTIPGGASATGPGRGLAPPFTDATRADPVGSGPVGPGFPNGHGTPPGRSRGPIIAGALGTVLVVTLAAAGGFVMWNHNKSKSGKGSPGSAWQNSPAAVQSPALFTADPTACNLLSTAQAQRLLGGRTKRQYGSRGSCSWTRDDNATFFSVTTIRLASTDYAQTTFNTTRDSMKEEPLRNPGTKLRTGPAIGDESYSYVRRQDGVPPFYVADVLVRKANLVVIVLSMTHATGYAIPDRTAGLVLAALGPPR